MHFAIIQLADSKQDPDKLLVTTKEIVKKYKVGLYAYNRNLAYCANCQKTFYGIPPKCPLCGSVNMLICPGHVSAKRFQACFLNSGEIYALNNQQSIC